MEAVRRGLATLLSGDLLDEHSWPGPCFILTSPLHTPVRSGDPTTFEDVFLYQSGAT